MIGDGAAQKIFVAIPPSTDIGDILYLSGPKILSRLPKGGSKNGLFQNTALTAPEWGMAREVLTTTREYYVRPDGSNSNTGLVNNAGGAFLTIQRAIEVIYATLDLGGQNVNINVADGTYANGISATTPWAGPGLVRIRGNTTTPANVVISITNGHPIYCSGGAKVSITGMELRTTTSGFGIVSTGVGTQVVCEAGIRFGACANSHMLVDDGANITFGADYSIVGGAQTHWNVNSGSSLVAATRTVTITGTPAFSVSFCAVAIQARAIIYGMTFSGAATGKRFFNTNLSVIHTNGGGVNYIPGNAAGTTDASSKYI